jgi:hypothetical protein
MTTVRPMFPPRKTAPDVFRSAFFDLEDKICDLDRLSEVAETLVSRWLDDTGPELPRSGELATCMVQVLRDKCRLKVTYYAAFRDGGGLTHEQ